MEITDDPFAQLGDIDWQAAFTDALHQTVADEQDPDTLRERLESLMHDANALAEAQTFQALAATMGAMCCSNPIVQMAVEGSERLRGWTEESCEPSCDDDHDDDEEEDEKNSKKRRQTPLLKRGFLLS